MPVFVDANGNIQSGSSNTVATAQPLRSSVDVEAGSQRGGIRTLADVGYSQASGDEDGSVQQGGVRERLIGILTAFKFRSAPGVLVTLQLFFYFVSLWIVTPRAIITPNPMSVWKLGSGNAGMDRCVTAAGGKFVVELRRLVMPIFLHTGFFHILFNVLFQVLSCPRALASYGSRRFLVLFLATGTCGNLLSGAAGHSGVGASTSCYGVVGAFIVQAVTLWKQQEDPAWRNYIRNMLLLNCGIGLGWELINWNHLDHFGHLGGLLSGLCMGVILAPEGISILKWRITLAALVLGIFACTLKIFVLDEAIDCEQAWLQYSQG